MSQVIPQSKEGVQITRIKTYVPWPHLLRELVQQYEPAKNWTNWGISDVLVEEDGYIYTWWIETKGQTNVSH